MQPIEQIITEAMLGTTDTDTAMCRVSCNAVASRQMFCQICSNILDETTTVVLTVKTPKRRVVAGYCTRCWELRQRDTLIAAEVTQTPILIEGWNGEIFSQGEVG